MINFDERELEESLFHLIEFGRVNTSHPDDEMNEHAPALGQLTYVTTYELGAFLTMDRGIVLTMRDGSEFQLTIKRSKNPEWFEDEE